MTRWLLQAEGGQVELKGSEGYWTVLELSRGGQWAPVERQQPPGPVSGPGRGGEQRWVDADQLRPPRPEAAAGLDEGFLT